MRRAVYLLLLLALLAGCTTATGGEAAPANPTGIVLPPRPREVRLDGLDPCALFTAAQRKKLGLDGEPRFKSLRSQLYGGAVIRGCTIVGNEPRAIIVGGSLVTTTGIELWTSGKLDATLRPIQVRGFPAVEAVPARFTDFCTVIIDVADGELVDVQAGDGGRKPPITQKDLCTAAQQAADEVMATLLTLR